MRGPRVALSLLAAAVLMLVVVVARGQSAVPSRMADPHIEPGLPFLPRGAGNSPTKGPRVADVDPGLAFKIVLAVIAVMLLLAVALSVLAALRGRALARNSGIGAVIEPVEGTVDTVMRLRLREAVQQARDVLARPGGEPRDAVIRAWVTLENATEHRRAPHQTATEFTVSLLASETADERALADLRALYHRARFGRDSGEQDAADARDALDRILATIR
ncbi:DUF4129 domain-containing protein [Actinophytocola oryzae]|nr:DUF4129 domain-containing protein [Actinophytocola oryzae]